MDKDTKKAIEKIEGFENFNIATLESFYQTFSVQFYKKPIELVNGEFLGFNIDIFKNLEEYKEYSENLFDNSDHVDDYADYNSYANDVDDDEFVDPRVIKILNNKKVAYCDYERDFVSDDEEKFALELAGDKYRNVVLYTYDEAMENLQSDDPDDDLVIGLIK